MFYPAGGEVYEVKDNAFGFTYMCNLPPIGYGLNSITNEIEETDIFPRDENDEDNYWERYVLPKDWDKKRKSEKERQKFDRYYIDPYLESIRSREWKRRLCGIWFYKYSAKTKKVELKYITGTHYLYITYWKFQGKLMDFRINDMEAWYVVKYCETDPNCLGLNEITKRKLGKTAKLGCWIYDRTSKPPFNQHAGLQSKADDDAAEVMKKAIVQPWQKLPDFFRPIYDTMKSDDPNELRFFHTARRGSTTEIERDEEDALESWIDYGASGEGVYDGPELYTYGADEAGKCFGLGTKIRMYDGSIKNVEDIKNGEFVMGDDSGKRLVYGVTKGREQMYNVLPNKGYTWSCNESHIMSLRWCTKKNTIKGWEQNSIVNISIKDYLQLKKWEQNHLMLYRKGVEYKEVEHSLSPYFLGLWLGDGTKKSVEITTNDSEIVDYLYVVAKNYNLEISRNEDIRYYLGGSSKRKVKGVMNGSYVEFNSLAAAKKHFGYHPDTKFSETTVYKENNFSVEEFRGNPILYELNRLNVIGNKHIPKDYLIDSKENRLKLLAGLIDSDGYLLVKDGKPKSFEITQKLRKLAYQIQDLALSLGFYCSVKPKMARMKRLDKSVYECMVYRVTIYGDLYVVPTIVERKKAKKTSFHPNRRNPQSCGFSVQPCGVGDYYGFAVNKNSLFLLSDGTVVHNTKKPVSIKERQSIVRFCSEIDGEFGNRKQYYTTTVEIEAGEEDNYEFQEMTAMSNPMDRDDNGRTMTGLYTYFLPAQKAMFFDKYGDPDEERAIIYLLNTRRKLEQEGKTRELSSFKRKNPMSFKEAFSMDGSQSLYDPELLNEQLEDVLWKTDLTEKGDLKWYKDSPFVIEKEVNGIKSFYPNKVIWVDNPNGVFEKVKGWWPKDPNKIYENNGVYLPNNNFSYRIGYDTFKYDKTKDKRRSNAAAFVYSINDDLYPSEFDNMFVLRYSNRPESRRKANMCVLMMAWLCGCQMLVEKNAGDHYREHYREWGCEGFLMWLPNESEPGITTDGSGKTVQSICNYTEQYINEHIKKVFFKTLIRKETGWMGFKVEDTQKFDEPMAAGITLIAVKGKQYRRITEMTQDIESILPYNKAV